MANSTHSNTSGGHYFRPSPEQKLQFVPFSAELAGKSYELVSARGIFSPQGIDKGTQVLLDRADPPTAPGNFLDLGCGWGPIALTLALEQPDATVWALDVNDHALASTAENARRLGLEGVKPVKAEMIPEDVSFQLIWSNPPIRVGKAVLHELLMTWVPRLAPEGSAVLVVQKHLGSDSLLKWLKQNLPAGFDSERIASVKSFRLLQITRKE